MLEGWTAVFAIQCSDLRLSVEAGIREREEQESALRNDVGATFNEDNVGKN